MDLDLDLDLEEEDIYTQLIRYISKSIYYSHHEIDIHVLRTHVVQPWISNEPSILAMITP